MRNNSFPRRKKPGMSNFLYNHRGFTLIETVIILIAIAIVSGGIWVAGQHVMENYRISRSLQQITKVTQNIREYYMNRLLLPFPHSPPTITSNLDGLNLFPVEMRRTPSAGPGGGPIDHPMDNTAANGSFQVDAIGCTLADNTSSCFALRLLNLTPSACIKLLLAIPLTDPDLGMARVAAQAYTVNMFYNGQNVVSASQAEAWCNNAGAANEVDFVFQLRH